ncbi:glycosyltransferase [Candidatus Woesearchaeota archaeon]|nr:glycosyltransferase [Candidatus Woesearchaeota archaeon]
MDLVVVHPNFVLKGGAELVITKIAERFNPVIYTYAWHKENSWEQLKECDVRVVKPLRMDSLFMMRTGLGYYQMKVKDDYDIINAHFPPSQFIRHRNPRVLWYCHSPGRAAYDLYQVRMREYSPPVKVGHYIFTKLYRHLNAEVVSQIECVLANSRNVQYQLQQYLNKESTVLNPAVDPQQFVNECYDRYFFYPGRITPSKRLEYVIAAYRLFMQRNPSSPFKLVIAGGLQEKDRAYLEQMRKLHSCIMIDVPEAQFRQLYARCYAVLFSGINEDFGIVPLEAMASQKPIISVNEGGPRESIIDGTTGYLVNSVQEMAEKMELLTNNPSLVEKMGRVGRKHVIANYSWKRFLDEFEKHARTVARTSE